MADEPLQEDQEQEETPPRYSAGVGIRKPANLAEMDVDGGLQRESWGKY
jgi:hypothetical protein